MRRPRHRSGGPHGSPCREIDRRGPAMMTRRDSPQLELLVGRILVRPRRTRTGPVQCSQGPFRRRTRCHRGLLRSFRRSRGTRGLARKTGARRGLGFPRCLNMRSYLGPAPQGMRVGAAPIGVRESLRLIEASQVPAPLPGALSGRRGDAAGRSRASTEWRRTPRTGGPLASAASTPRATGTVGRSERDQTGWRTPGANNRRSIRGGQATHQAIPEIPRYWPQRRPAPRPDAQPRTGAPGSSRRQARAPHFGLPGPRHHGEPTCCADDGTSRRTAVLYQPRHLVDGRRQRTEPWMDPPWC